MSDEILCDGSQFKVTYFPEGVDEHRLYVKMGGHYPSYVLARGVLKEMTSAGPEGIEAKLRTYNEDILLQLGENGIEVGELWTFLSLAHVQEEVNRCDFVESMRNK